MLQKFFFLIIILGMGMSSFAQDAYLTARSENTEKIYPGGEQHEVKIYPHKFKSKKPKNIILLIGDGMGVNQVFAGITANGGKLFLDNFKHIGFAKTHSSDNFITDSAAGGTAISTGKKTYNGAIGVDVDKNPVKTILEESEENGLVTGLVSSSAITHATPASFIAHQASRSSYEDIAADFLKTDIDVFIGGGYDHFTKREDGRNLVNELKAKGYTVEQDMAVIKDINSGKLAGLVAPEHPGRVAERKDMLPVATQTAINILSAGKKGFFLMVEGSQIDWGGHAKSTVHVVEDMLDFDKAVGKALEFAASNKKTLVIVTSDHETGGMTVLGGSYETGRVRGEFTTGDHSPVMVPVFAYGPGAENFTGIMDNTDIHKKMIEIFFKK
jgi:alkaline phosphatase